MASKGLFITFEGSEGSGKSTQIRRVSALFHTLGREVLTLREPGGTLIGERIRNLLQFDKSVEGMTPKSELLLFAASRAQLVGEVISPALERGAVVLCDRFVDSTTVYQGVARALDRREVATINDFAAGGILPDLTLLLDLDAEVGRQRACLRVGPDDRMEQEGSEFYEAVRCGYLELARNNPHRFAIIDAMVNEDVVEASIIAVLKERCHGLF